MRHRASLRAVLALSVVAACNADNVIRTISPTDALARVDMSSATDLVTLVCGDPATSRTIMDVLTPSDLTTPDLTVHSNLDQGMVSLIAGSSGRLVVTSVFSSAFVVGDTAAPFDASTGQGGFNHFYVYSFGQPPVDIVPGAVLPWVCGDLARFEGFPELQFPTMGAARGIAPLPAPIALMAGAPGSPTQTINLLRLDAATVTTIGHVCPIDTSNATGQSWTQSNTFQLGDPTGNCDSSTTFGIALPEKTLGTFDPLQCMASSPSGKGCQIAVTGMLRSQSTKGGNTFWTIVPRSAADIVIE